MSHDVHPSQIYFLFPISPLPEDHFQVDVVFVNVSSHEAKNTSVSHLNKFYVPFHEIKKQRFDGFILSHNYSCHTFPTVREAFYAPIFDLSMSLLYSR